ncbi:hypothetical protein M0R45_036502 [Rubus argutus]|uniref:Uncharacterized protein n=1 Tax=Rubus argutus TaxID=59490 RepID=A0AAW1VY32_RUBAR
MPTFNFHHNQTMKSAYLQLQIHSQARDSTAHGLRIPINLKPIPNHHTVLSNLYTQTHHDILPNHPCRTRELSPSTDQNHSRPPYPISAQSTSPTGPPHHNAASAITKSPSSSPVTKSQP